MASQPRGARKALALRVDFPPRADQVSGCPPHFWIIQGGWQRCKKCAEAKVMERIYPLWKWKAEG